MFHYSLRLIDEPKMSEIRILNLCHKKSILVDIYRQSLPQYRRCDKFRSGIVNLVRIVNDKKREKI